MKSEAVIYILNEHLQGEPLVTSTRLRALLLSYFQRYDVNRDGRSSIKP